MGIDFDELTGILRTVKVDYFGKGIVVTYKPDAITPEKEAELARLRVLAQESANGDGDGDATALARNAAELAGRLAEVIASWDVVRKGEPMPPTKENLMTFPNAVLLHVSQAIGEDMAPKARNTRR